MKTTLHYSTFVTLSIFGCGITASVDLGCKPLNEVLDYIQDIFNDNTLFYGKSVTHVVATDTNTGELIAECDPDDQDETYNDWDYNEDMGFDPYLGCYSDDC